MFNKVVKRRSKETKSLGAVCFTVLAGLMLCWLSCLSNVHAEETNIVINPSAEEIRAGETKGYIGASEKIRQDAPENWGVYIGGGKITWGSTTKESHSGERSAFLETREFDETGIVNAALIVGESYGHEGYDAYPALPNTYYRFSFWMKTDFSQIPDSAPSVMIYALTWTTEEAESGDRKHILAAKPYRITPSSEWQKHDGVFTTSADTKKFVLYLKMFADEAKGGKLGRIYVDDVYIAPIE